MSKKKDLQTIVFAIRDIKAKIGSLHLLYSKELSADDLLSLQSSEDMFTDLYERYKNLLIEEQKGTF